MRGYDQDEANLDEQAADWLVRLGDEDGAECHMAFLEWIRQSPRHVSAFKSIAEWWLRLDSLDPQRRVDVHALLAHSQKVVPLRPRAKPAFRRGIARWMQRSRRRVAAIGRCAAVSAGAVIVIAGLFVVEPLSADSTEYATAVGEQRIVRLRDGTSVHLNTDTRIEVRFDRDERTVRLLGGETLLEIAKDSRRPFRIVAGPVTIRDIGTILNVRRNLRDLEVMVVEGCVQVRHEFTTRPGRLPGAVTQVDAGEVATVSYEPGRPPQVRTVSRAEVSARLAWKEGMLEFEGRPLRELVPEINRYNTRPLLIDDPAIADMRLGGRMAPTDLSKFLQSLELLGVKARQPLSETNASEQIHLVRSD